MAVQMPFGKHKGKYLHDIPRDYLMWARDNCNLQPTLKEAIERVLFGEDSQVAYTRGYCQGLAAGRKDAQFLTKPNPVLFEIVQRWYREMSVKHHPDQGGSKEVMAALNDLRDRFSKLLSK